MLFGSDWKCNLVPRYPVALAASHRLATCDAPLAAEAAMVMLKQRWKQKSTCFHQNGERKSRDGQKTQRDKWRAECDCAEMHTTKLSKVHTVTRDGTPSQQLHRFTASESICAQMHPAHEAQSTSSNAKRPSNNKPVAKEDTPLRHKQRKVLIEYILNSN